MRIEKIGAMKDYLEFHIENGKKEYQIIKSLIRQYSLPLECALYILASGYSIVWRTVRDRFQIW
jgi:hypothetical protein